MNLGGNVYTKAQYSLIVLKVPLNPNQSINMYMHAKFGRDWLKFTDMRPQNKMFLLAKMLVCQVLTVVLCG